MSAAFALQPSGPPAPCSYPQCTLEAFHEGEHLLPAKPDKRIQFPGPRYGVCVICQVKFTVFGDHDHPMPRICDSRLCAEELLRLESPALRVICACPQRSYAHPLSVHKQIRSESYNPKLRYRYPWSLCLGERLELSTERD